MLIFSRDGKVKIQERKQILFLRKSCFCKEQGQPIHSTMEEKGLTGREPATDSFQSDNQITLPDGSGAGDSAHLKRAKVTHVR